MNLDNEERLHVALNAIDRKDFGVAVENLKYLYVEDHSVEVVYLLSATYAELGLFERAISGMEEALKMKPDLYLALLQKGLLYLRVGKIQIAAETFDILFSLESDSYFHYIGGGLKFALDDKIIDAVNLLKLGIKHNTENPSLNETISQIIYSLEGTEKGGDDSFAADYPSEILPSKKYLLSKYGK